MSTRCNIHFREGKEVIANIYLHGDGYPHGQRGVLSLLSHFFAETARQTKGGPFGPRFSCAAYLAAKFVVYQAQRNAPDKTKPLDFLSLGIMREDAGDAAFVYEVDCGKRGSNGWPAVTYDE